MKKTLEKSKRAATAGRKADSPAMPCSDAAPAAQLLESDDEKYSPNLKAWLRKNARRLWPLEKLIVMQTPDGMKYIGWMDDGFLIGSNIGTVLCKGKHAETGAYLGSHKWTELKDFWTRYLKIGVCATDEDHSWYKNRWQQISKTHRVCRYCGLDQKLVNKSHVVKTETWETTKRVTAHRNVKLCEEGGK